jgi:hypothetical protein
MRYILRTAGVDADAPWVPEAYLDRYAPVALTDLQPGDIVIMPGWATMYVGNGMLLNSNEAEGLVTHTPLSVAAPLGAVRPPYSGAPTAPLPADPLPTDGDSQAPPAGQLQYETTTDSLALQPLPADPLAQPHNELADPTTVADPMTANLALVADPAMVAEAVEPTTTEAIEPY